MRSGGNSSGFRPGTEDSRKGQGFVSEQSCPVLLILAERFPPDVGGVARSALRTAFAVSSLGWRVHVLAWTKTLPSGVLDTVRTVGSGNTGGEIVVHRLGLFSDQDFSMQYTNNVLEWLHQEFQFSAVWGHYVYPAGFMAVVFAEFAGLPSTVSARGNDIDRLMYPPGDFARLMWTLERATVVSCVSRDLAGKVEMLTAKRITPVVVPNVVDTDVFRPPSGTSGSDLRAELGISDAEVVLGFCGELRHKKGLPFILSALATVQQSRPSCLLVIGEVRSRDQTHLAAFAAAHPQAARRVVITGHLAQQEDVVRHLQLCDIFLHPSVWDGLPNAILEAMACGRIVLASDAGGIPEAIVHGTSGFMIPKAQLNHLGTGIMEILGLGETERDQIAVAARQRILDCFQKDREAKQLSSLLGQLTAMSAGQQISES